MQLLMEPAAPVSMYTTAEPIHGFWGWQSSNELSALTGCPLVHKYVL